MDSPNQQSNKNSLSALYNDDVILFTGQVFRFNNEGKRQNISNIICKGFSEAEDKKIGLTFQYVGSNFLKDFQIENNVNNDFIYVQMYTPNPNFSAYTPAIVNTSVFTNTYTLREGSNGWIAENGVLKQSISVYGIDLEKYPFIINMDDDSLENYKEYVDIDNFKINYNVATNTSTITFYTKQNTFPSFIISIDLIVILTQEGKDNISGDWVSLTIPKDTTTSNPDNILTITANDKKLNTISNGERELVVFCGNGDTTFYNNITEVSSGSPGIYNITLADTTIVPQEDTILYICQVNNISNIHDITIYENSWQQFNMVSSLAEPGSTANTPIPYWVTSWPDNKEEALLLNKHQPLIYAKSGFEEAFSKITEIKIIQGKMYFYAKEKIKEDIELKIIDFK